MTAIIIAQTRPSGGETTTSANCYGTTVKFDGRAEKQILDIENHTQAVKILLDDLIRFNIIASYDEITGVGHRVVAGGEYFKESALVDEEVIQKVEELSLLAPLHNPANAAGIRAFKELLPDIIKIFFERGQR